MELPPPIAVKVVYIIPADAQPWAEAPVRATQAVEAIQKYVSYEMNRLNHGERTFEIERVNGLVHFTPHKSKHSKAEFEKGHARALELCKDKDLAGQPQQVYAELFIIEAYSITDGEVSGDVAGCSKRRACVSSLHLKAALLEWIHSDEKFFGEMFPWISPEAILNWKHRKGAKGDIAGRCFGVIAHELLHCFGAIDHDDADGGKPGEHIMGTGRNIRTFLQGKGTVGTCMLSERSAKNMRDNLPESRSHP